MIFRIQLNLLSHIILKNKIKTFILTSFTNIIPLKQFTKLVIEMFTDDFVEIFELLLLSPNIHTVQIALVSLEYSNLI
jgi:hypothetical protein